MFAMVELSGLLFPEDDLQVPARIQKNKARVNDYLAGMACLPKIDFNHVSDRNGEALATDEAAVWKRVLNYRVSSAYANLRDVLETHPGVGISTAIYKYVGGDINIVSLEDYRLVSNINQTFDIVDIDPFGFPYDAIEKCQHVFDLERTLLMVSNGEAFSVVRNLKTQHSKKTKNYGKKMGTWVVKEYLPVLEEITGFKVKFFYVFPTTVRAILSNLDIPEKVFSGCPRWMWWLKKYNDLG